MAEESKEMQVSWACLALGFVLYIIWAFTHFRTSSIDVVLLVIVLFVAFGTAARIIAAFITATVLKVSFGELKTAILKLAGIYMLAGGLAAVIPTVGGIVGGATAFALLMWLFELELYEAVIFSIVSYVVGWIAAIAVFAVIGSML